MSTALDCGCAARPTGPARRRPARLAWAALVPGLAIAVAPKCPLCIAAYLMAAGLGAGVAFPLGRALPAIGAAIAAAAAIALVIRLARRRARRLGAS